MRRVRIYLLLGLHSGSRAVVAGFATLSGRVERGPATGRRVQVLPELMRRVLASPGGGFPVASTRLARVTASGA